MHIWEVSMSNKQRDIQTSIDTSILAGEFSKYLKEIASDIHPALSDVGIQILHNQLKGHICTSLDDLIQDAGNDSPLKSLNKGTLETMISESVLFGDGSELSPFVVENSLLYTHKFWKYEQELADWINHRAKLESSVTEEVVRFISENFEEIGNEPDWQKVAVLVSQIKLFMILSGGPGTGKTHTVKQIIRTSLKNDPEMKIGLAAPTGKAAQRMNESLGDTNTGIKAVTLHSLLGARGTSYNFSFNESNPLPYDLVIVDEASMMDLPMWVHLIRALSGSTRLILLGDQYQLESVEAGSILGDICEYSDNSFSSNIVRYLDDRRIQISDSSSLNDCIITLTKSFRFGNDSGIYQLSESIKKGDSNRVEEILHSDAYPDVTLVGPGNEAVDSLIENYATKPFRKAVYSKKYLDFYYEYQILSALRKGKNGVEKLNQIIEHHIKKSIGIAQTNEWYEGRPVMITRNNRILQVKNGEIGICNYEEGSGYTISFEGSFSKKISVSRIQDYEPAYVNTIHKSQGSEYKNVAIILPEGLNKLFSKELLYTAVTRARQSLLVIGSLSTIKGLIVQNSNRRSGLSNKIWRA